MRVGQRWSNAGVTTQVLSAVGVGKMREAMRVQGSVFYLGSGERPHVVYAYSPKEGIISIFKGDRGQDWVGQAARDPSAFQANFDGWTFDRTGVHKFGRCGTNP
jgi:hypothetical protein